MIFAHLQVTGGVLQSLQVGTFQEVRACGGSENLGDGMGLVVGPDRVGRGLLQDCQGRLGTQVAAHLALPNHQLQPLHRQRAERNTVRPGLLAKTVSVQDPWRSSISSIACSSRSRCGFTVQRTAPRFFVGTRTTKANPLIIDHQGQAPRWLCVSQVHRPGLPWFPCQPRGMCHSGRTAGGGCPPRNHRDSGLEEAVSRGSHRG